MNAPSDDASNNVRSQHKDNLNESSEHSINLTKQAADDGEGVFRDGKNDDLWKMELDEDVGRMLCLMLTEIMATTRDTMASTSTSPMAVVILISAIASTVA